MRAWTRLGRPWRVIPLSFDVFRIRRIDIGLLRWIVHVRKVWFEGWERFKGATSHTSWKLYTYLSNNLLFLYHCTPLFHWRSLGASHIEAHYEDSQCTDALDIGLKTKNIHVARTHWKTCVNCPIKIQQNPTMNEHISRNILYRYLWIFPMNKTSL